MCVLIRLIQLLSDVHTRVTQLHACYIGLCSTVASLGVCLTLACNALSGDTYGQFSKLGSSFGYPKYSGLPQNSNPRRGPEFTEATISASMKRLKPS